MTEYTATTTNSSNKVTAVPADENATVEIKVGETEIENGSQANWSEGENVLTVKVTNGAQSTSYTVTVTK